MQKDAYYKILRAIRKNKSVQFFFITFYMARNKGIDEVV